ncbi:hypothetical protein GO988_13445 [Hymenobacter sp. HMF4947]|uniref:Uncharacterized protein n=1 Tax=Hymenobacter ginkgonis TaxID=2682976 RepID=A0A7K1TG01_9BACT|nr:hypothetical protein [Hymenobacter ginkgonis]MVN77334.1 hypothetical protein [Hymenobacter ginkgonis]
MKKMLLLPLCAALFASAATLTSCGNGGTTAQAPTTPAAQAKAAEDSVMARHDRLMGQSEQVVELAAKLQATPRPPRPLLAKLQAADQAMMTWMHQYQAPDSAAPAPQRLAYLQDQQQQLAAIEKQLTSALDSAKAAVGRMPAAATAAPTPAPGQ